MTTEVDLLRRLAAEAAAETAERRQRISGAELERRLLEAPPVRDLRAALAPPGLGVIAEYKPASPVRGRFTDPLGFERRLERYLEAGAVALSILCQVTSFGGDPSLLTLARRLSSVPVLRKDFVTDPYQLIEARVLGADAVLLIAAILDRKALAALTGECQGLGMEAVVEVHDEAEVEVALAAGARVIGVNHRDLRDFSIDRDRTARLRPLVPEWIPLIAESGVAGAADARRLRAAGADAVLVGEALMRSSWPERLIRELRAA